MNKKILYIILAFGGILIITLSALILTISFQKKVEKVPLEVEVKPQGELDYIPSEITVHFSKSFPGAQGVFIKEDEIKSFIKFEPDINAYGAWISERKFLIHFAENPLLDQKYEITVLKIPLVTEVESIPPIKVSFKTPPFKVLSASLTSLEEKMAKINVGFNVEPQIKNIMNFIKIYDSGKRKVKIIDIRPKKYNPEEIVITVPVERAPEKYTLIVKRGLRCVRKAFLKKDFEFEIPIGFIQNPLHVDRYEVQESEEGYMIIFTISAPRERELEVQEKNLHSLIRIKPPLSFRTNASGRNIYIFGDFMPEKSYEITLKTGIRSKMSRLMEDYKITLKIPEKREALQFLYRGRYFGKKGEWKLPLKVSRIDSIKLNITYMPPSNVLFWHLRDWGRKSMIKSYGEDVVSNYKIIPEDEKTNLVWVDLKEILNKVSKGVYLVEAKGIAKKRYLFDRIAVVISDISLAVKWYDKNIYLWAFNSQTLEPEQNVNIEIRSSKNFITGKGLTDANGFCRIPVLKKGRDVYLVFAEKGDEWTYLHTPSLKVPKQNYDITGENPEIPYLAYIYPERDLYRPGEEVHFAVIMREPHTFNGVSLPVKITIRDPRGRNTLSLSGKTDDMGIAEFSFPTTPASPTGKYILELRTGDKILCTKGIFIETFVPQRMRVEIEVPEKFDIYKKFPVTVKAEYLFGAPASGEDYALWLNAKETEFHPSGYYDYVFGMHRFRKARIPAYHSGRKTGKLDEAGMAKVFMQVPPDILFQEPVLLTINAEVKEGGSGRVTSRNLEKIIHQRPFYIGLKSGVKRVIRDVPVKVKGVLLKPDGSLYKKRTKLKYRIYLLRWSYSYHYYEDYYWDSRVQKIPVSEGKEVFSQEGKFAFIFTPKTSYNDYLVEVIDEKTGTTTQLKIAGWGWWYREEERVESPEIIPIRVEKQEYDESETVNVEALIPFEGKILWTCELDSIYHYEIKPAKGELAKWSFKAPSGISTVYVSALLIRSGENYLVQRAFGIQRVRIRPKRAHLDLKIDVHRKIRPGQELVIKVNGGEKFKGTIAVVDEGILQITSFKTPDPYAGILRDMRLLLNTAESFGWIVKKFLQKTGGGLAEKEKEFPEARFARMVSFWSGILESSAGGRIVYKIKIPQYNGRLRVMVSGVNGKKLGSAEKDVVVKSDVIVSPTIPRFMHTEDDFNFPITLINTTKSSKKSDIKINIEGAKAKENRFSVKLSPEEKKILWIQCTALDVPGSIKINIEAETDKERYYEEFEIPLYPNVPYITESEYISIEPGEIDLTEYFEDFYPKAHTANLILAPIPGLSKLNHLRYAIRYPYGCIEQTSTRAFLLLKLERLLPLIAPGLSKEKYQDMVNHGIRRIISMQTPSGGFAFWPGGGMPAPWATAYATLVLIEAKKSGFFVPQGVIDAALNYLDALLDKSGFVYYVLARGGLLSKKPDMVDRLVSLTRKEKFDIPSGLWISGAINEAGRNEEARRFLEVVLKQKEPKIRRYYHDFYSPLQYKGMKLYMIQIIEPENPEIEDLLIDISRALSKKRSWYYSTQELAWCLTGIGMYAERMEEQKYEAELKVNGKKYKPEKEKGIFSWNLKNTGGKRVTLNLKSRGKLYLCIENTGFSKKVRSFIEEFSGLSLERNLYTYDGKKADYANQGDLLVIKVKIKSSGYYENTAIEVPVPAGLEIENPRIGIQDLPSWTGKKKIMKPKYVDIRDDRVIIFGRTIPDTLRYYFLARAVTPGNFFFEPIRGFVMYNPDINGHTDAGYFQVNKK